MAGFALLRSGRNSELTIPTAGPVASFAKSGGKKTVDDNEIFT